MIKIALVDDEKESIDLLEKYIGQICDRNKIRYEIAKFKDGEELIAEYRPVFDMIYLDIEMERSNGMEIAEIIRKKDRDTILIFVTQMAQYAVRGYRVDALDYMVKPIDYYSFELVFRKALGRLKMKRNRTLCLNNGNETKIVKMSQIQYVEVFDHYITYNLGKEEVTMKRTLAEAEKELDASMFYKCNRSFIVNLEYITSVGKDSILVGDKRVEVSRARKRELIQAATLYYGGKF